MGRISFFSPTQAALVTSPNALASMVRPRMLTMPWVVDASNELNANTADEIMWNSASALAENDTTLTLTAGGVADSVINFVVTTPSKYCVSYNAYMFAETLVSFTMYIAVNGTIRQTTYTAVSATGQVASGSACFELDVGDVIHVYCGNASGPNSGTHPVSPADELFGKIDIIQYV
jgi:hypothetical protein